MYYKPQNKHPTKNSMPKIKALGFRWWDVNVGRLGVEIEAHKVTDWVVSIRWDGSLRAKMSITKDRHWHRFSLNIRRRKGQ